MASASDIDYLSRDKRCHANRMVALASDRALIRRGRREDARRAIAWALQKDPNDIELPAKHSPRNTADVLVAVAFGYFAICFVLSQVGRYFEHRRTRDMRPATEPTRR